MSMKALTETVRYIEAQPVVTLPGCAQAVLLVLADMAGDDGRAWPSVATLARRVNRRERMVQYALTALQGAGALAREDRAGRATVYTLTPATECTPAVDCTPATDCTPTPAVDCTPPLQHVAPGGAAHCTQNPKYPSTEPSVEPTPRARAVAVPDRFDEFWQAYPRHVAKSDARKAWVKAAAKTDAADIIAGAARYAADPNRSDQYTKHPATWLNGGCWEDDPAPARQARLTPQQQIQANNRARLDAALAAEARATRTGEVVQLDQHRPRQIGGRP